MALFFKLYMNLSSTIFPLKIKDINNNSLFELRVDLNKSQKLHSKTNMLYLYI